MESLETRRVLSASSTTLWWVEPPPSALPIDHASFLAGSAGTAPAAQGGWVSGAVLTVGGTLPTVTDAGVATPEDTAGVHDTQASAQLLPDRDLVSVAGQTSPGGAAHLFQVPLHPNDYRVDVNFSWTSLSPHPIGTLLVLDEGGHILLSNSLSAQPLGLTLFLSYAGPGVTSSVYVKFVPSAVAGGTAPTGAHQESSGFLVNIARTGLTSPSGTAGSVSLDVDLAAWQGGWGALPSTGGSGSGTSGSYTATGGASAMPPVITGVSPGPPNLVVLQVYVAPSAAGTGGAPAAGPSGAGSTGTPPGGSSGGGTGLISVALPLPATHQAALGGLLAAKLPDGSEVSPSEGIHIDAVLTAIPVTFSRQASVALVPNAYSPASGMAPSLAGYVAPPGSPPGNQGGASVSALVPRAASFLPGPARVTSPAQLLPGTGALQAPREPSPLPLAVDDLFRPETRLAAADIPIPRHRDAAPEERAELPLLLSETARASAPPGVFAARDLSPSSAGPRAEVTAAPGEGTSAGTGPEEPPDKVRMPKLSRAGAVAVGLSTGILLIGVAGPTLHAPPPSLWRKRRVPALPSV